MAERTFFDFLAESLSAIQTGSPPAHQELIRSLGQLCVSISVDGATRTLSVAGSRCVLLEPTMGSHAVLSSSRQAIVRLLDGSSSLLDELLTEGVHARGDVDTIIAVTEALLAFFRGAVRTPAVSQLLDEYLV